MARVCAGGASDLVKLTVAHVRVVPRSFVLRQVHESGQLKDGLFGLIVLDERGRHRGAALRLDERPSRSSEEGRSRRAVLTPARSPAAGRREAR